MQNFGAHTTLYQWLYSKLSGLDKSTSINRNECTMSSPELTGVTLLAAVTASAVTLSFEGTKPQATY